MPNVTVDLGDDLSKLAATCGLPSWRVIYDDSKNADYWAECDNPDVLKHGSQLEVPEAEPGQQPLTLTSLNVFEMKGEKPRLRLRIEDEKGEARTKCPYRLEIENRNPLSGKTDSDGVIDHMILPTDDKALLIVSVPSPDAPDGSGAEDVTYELQFGALEPVNEVSGQQARLNNLGFESGEVDGIFGPITKSSVKRFQKAEMLAVDGIVGPITRGALLKAHGS